MNKKIIDYCLVVRGKLSDLNEKIHELLKDGWQPHEGHSIVEGDDYNYYSQAMVKHESEDN